MFSFRPEVVTVGHLLKEIIHFPDRAVGPVLGSPAAYCAVGAGMLGTRTGIVTRIGNDMPENLLRPLHEAHVDVSGLRVDGSCTTTDLLTYNKKGQKTIRFLKRAPNILFEDFPEAYLSARVVHICPIDNEIPVSTLGALSRLGLKLSVDLGGYGGAASGGRLRVVGGSRQSALARLVRNFKIVKVSKEDCTHLLGEVSNIERAVPRLFLGYGAEVVALTLGSEGAFVATKNSSLRTSAFPVISHDPTGAGDVYAIAFAAEYSRTSDLERSAAFAVAAASFVVEKRGNGVDPARFGTRREVEDRTRRILDLGTVKSPLRQRKLLLRPGSA